MKVVHAVILLLVFLALAVVCSSGASISEIKLEGLFTTSNLQNNYKPYGYIAHGLG